MSSHQDASTKNSTTATFSKARITITVHMDHDGFFQYGGLEARDTYTDALLSSTAYIKMPINGWMRAAPTAVRRDLQAAMDAAREPF